MHKHLFRHSFLVGVGLCAAAPSGQADTTLTVHNQTGAALVVRTAQNPRAQPPDPGGTMFERWLYAGESGTFHFQVPDQDLDAQLTLVRFRSSAGIQFEGLSILPTLQLRPGAGGAKMD